MDLKTFTHLSNQLLHGQISDLEFLKTLKRFGQQHRPATTAQAEIREEMLELIDEVLEHAGIVDKGEMDLLAEEAQAWLANPVMPNPDAVKV